MHGWLPVISLGRPRGGDSRPLGEASRTLNAQQVSAAQLMLIYINVYPREVSDRFWRLCRRMAPDFNWPGMQRHRLNACRLDERIYRG